MTLADWAKAGWLRPHSTSRQEITSLLDIADRDLETCQVSGLPPDWQLNIAYNAALQSARAALAASGYRAERNAHHYRVIQSLSFTVGLDSESVALLDTFRKKRNISDYEMAGTVSESEGEEIYRLAGEIKVKVEEWLRENHPNLIT